MTFTPLLNDLVSRTDAVGAMFLDREGEAVEIVGALASREELHLVGAYQAVFLDRLRRICSETSTGDPERFEIRFQNSVFLNYVLDEEYYVVLIVGSRAPHALAWEALRRCREKLLQEM